MSSLLPEGTPDPELLAFAHDNGYVLLTHDERITQHIATRKDAGQNHHGVIIAGHHLQGKSGIGEIVVFIAELNALIKGEAATITEDLYNQIIYI